MRHVIASRRQWLTGVAAGLSAALLAAPEAVAATAAGSKASSQQSLEAAFLDVTAALNRGDLEAFYGFMHPKLLMIDEDAPWRLDLAGFKDHISFHGGGVWESFGWIPRDPRFHVSGNSGVVAGGATFRGKPKDAGYRLRHLLYSQGWIREAGAWRMVLWHQAPIVGLVTDGSPG
jgi:ketosteroid isomerase-like protein